MVPGIGGGELVVIAVVALIVVGPKDLPKLLRQLGRMVGKMRRMADEFRTSFEDMARQSELDELRKEVDALRAGQMQPSIVSDINEQMRAIEGDINAPSAAAAVPTAPVEVVDMPPEKIAARTPPASEAAPVSETAPISEAAKDNPQLDGKPPRKRAAPKTPAESTVKKPRAKKVVEADPVAKPKRTRRKAES
ncbi:MAG: Sec-independent protein translocase protein TatB [Asticcacaulis sp.]|uniref:Sec-independent protein translocase protein TatB n=1 Tax=Asticcacaulis sp. TaxID=1872648 RepID=UPI003F7CB34B